MLRALDKAKRDDPKALERAEQVCDEAACVDHAVRQVEREPVGGPVTAYSLQVRGYRLQAKRSNFEVGR